ncbi:MAG: hypothetical protein R8P61_11220 [Bacteroidia bacterium]|nr:hypothetical protein [Bacteroidia bacterium]
MSIRNQTLRFLALMLVGVFCSSCQDKEEAAITEHKFNPGHYVAVSPFFELSEIKHLDESGLKGINKRYFWRTLEPEKDAYDFSFIEKDLAYCSRHNKQLIVFLCDRAFWIKGAMPHYLKELEWKEEGGGFIPIRWDTEYLKRFIALGNAISERFNAHPNFEGIALQETSLGMPEDVLISYNYTPTKYRDALSTILTEFSTSFSGSNIFWYQNGIGGTNTLIREIADSISHRENIIMGGPDVLPYRKWLRYTYKIYGDYKDEISLFCSAQDDSYHHHKNDIRYSEKLPLHEEGYLTMEDIFLYARDEMHVQYLFWNYFYEGGEKGWRSFDDAIEVVKKYPVFNQPEIGINENR